ncbi:AsmA-like C-terminal domain-containing protein [Minwuia sp.]|uniref:YhdP family protein n=1 Tax=Minwuia sp. TaxID=2493630 RepID=UPI003A95B263
MTRVLIRIPLYAIGALFASVAILAVVAGWRLSEGPLPVSFLTPYIQSGITGLPEGWTLDVGETFVDWEGEENNLLIRAKDVGFINENRQRVLSIPDVGFSIHGDALLRGQIEPRDIIARDVNLVLTRGEAGFWRLGIGRVAETRPRDTDDAAMTARASELFGPVGLDGRRSGLLGRLRVLVLRETRILIVDDVVDRVYELDARRIAMRGGETGIGIVADADFRTRDLSVPMRADLVYRPDGEAVTGVVGFEQLSLPRLAKAFDGPTAMEGLDFPVSGTVRFTMTADTGLAPLELDLQAGAGEFDLTGLFAAALPVRAASLSATLHAGDRSLDISALSYDAGDFVAEASGTIGMSEQGPSIALAIRSEAVPMARVTAFWPTQHARNVRTWLDQNMKAGTAREVSATLNLTPETWRLPDPQPDAFDVSFAFDGARIRLLDPFEHFTDASGRLHVDGRSLSIETIAGRFGELALSDGTVTIEDFSKSPAWLRSDFVTRGSIAETAEAFLRGPLAAAVPDADTVLGIGGTAAARIQIGLPLSANTRLDQAQFAASANLTDVVADGVLGRLPLRAQSLVLKLDDRHLELEGTVRSERSWADVQWIEHFSRSDPVARQIGFSGNVDVEDIAAFGPEVAKYLSGVLAAKGVVREAPDGSVEATLNAELSGTAVSVPALGFLKGAGEPGTMDFNVTRSASGEIEIAGLRADLPGLLVRGDLSLNNAGELRSTRLEQVNLSNSQLSLVVRTVGEGQWQVQATGPRFDLRPWLARIEQQDTAGAGFDGSSLDLAVDELILSDGVVLKDAVGNLVLGDPLPTGDLRGVFNNAAAVQLNTSVEAGIWQFNLSSADAGAVLTGLGLGNAIRNGRLRVRGSAQSAAAFQGMATIEDFTLSETPTFARMFSLASFTGIGEALSGRGLSFSRAEMPFAYHDQRLNVRKGRMAGPSVGLTAEGYYRFDNDELRFVGNLIPAYSISSVLGAIPLLGSILGGDQGLFGVTYVVEGTAGSPVVKVNPLSALAPGILRRMFLEPVDEKPIEFPPSNEVQGSR